ncbi:hypothetical protein ACGC1H_002095 [Rhizoctonia solani]
MAMANIEVDVCHNFGLELKSRCDQSEHIPSVEYHSPPINILPTEILLHIFHFARYLWWRTPMTKDKVEGNPTWDRSIQDLMSLPYPEVLSHVCSLWRQIVLSSPSLWSHIDIYTMGRLNQIPLSRSSAFLTRAQGHELSLRFIFCHNAHHSWSNLAATESFCSAVGPRLKSLQIENYAPDTTVFSSIFEASLLHARPGVLTNLAIVEGTLRTGDDSEGLAGWMPPSLEQFGMTRHSLDNILQSVQSLRLHSLSLPWTSPAYRGLIDLRLSFDYSYREYWPFIEAAQLREILLACPGLRTFHSCIRISRQNSQVTLPPVPLNNLEMLNIRDLSLKFYEEFLPLIAPGDKPLTLVCRTHLREEPIPYGPALQAFFQRSKVTRLYITNRIPIDYHEHFPLDQLFIHSPSTLHTLGLVRFKITEHIPYRDTCINNLPSVQLECLSLRQCTIVPGVLRDMAMKFPAQILKLQDIPDEAQILEEICSMFPVVKRVCPERSRIESWDTWGTDYDVNASGT